MDFVSEFVIELLFKVVLCFPGAFVRWLFFWKSRSYMSLLEQSELNFFIGILLILVPLIVITLYKHFL